MLGGTVFQVSGMTCSHCEASVEKAVLTIDGIKAVKANASKGEIKVKGILTDDVIEKIKEVVSEAGFLIKE